MPEIRHLEYKVEALEAENLHQIAKYTEDALARVISANWTVVQMDHSTAAVTTPYGIEPRFYCIITLRREGSSA